MNFGGIRAFTLLTIIAFIYSINAVGIDDFGNRRRPHSSFINDGSYKTSFSSINNPSSSINIDASDGIDSIRVVCVNEGCNTTKSSDQSGDTISTDVVLHIKTKVNLNQNKSKPVDDTPDFPVVIRTDNYNSNNYNGIRTEPKSISIPSNGPPIYQNTRTHTQGSNFYLSGSQYGSSRSFYPFQSNNKPYPATFYQNMPNPNPEVNINFRSSPPIAMDVTSDLLSTNFKSNGIEMPIPYFDPSLHRHHYSESPPPQNVLYPKSVGVTNPVEFKVMRPTWRPSQWHNQFNQYNRHGALHTGSVKCSCENEDDRTGFNGYSSQVGRSSAYYPSHRDFVNDPGANK